MASGGPQRSSTMAARVDAAPEEELALLLSGTDERRAASQARIEALAARVDGTALLRFLRLQRVHAVLGSRLREAAPECLSDDEWAMLDHWQLDAEGEGIRHAMAQEGLVRQLAAKDIPAVPLKGCSLSERLYGHPGRRESSDIDLLVPVAQLDDAVRAVAPLGWSRPIRDPGDRSALPRLHVAVTHAGPLPAVEIHWRVDWRDQGGFAADMLRRATASGDAPAALDALDEFASLLLFYARDGFAGLRLGLDVATWWDRFGASLPADGLAPLMREHPSLAPALRAAVGAADMLVGLPAGAVLPGHRMHRRESLARDLGNWRLRGDLDRIQSDVTLVDGLLTPRGDFRAYVARHLLVPTARIEQYYRLPSTARVRLRLLQALHPVKVLARYAWTYWQARIARPPTA